MMRDGSGEHGADPHADDPESAMRRLKVVIRLLEEGMPVRALEALLPGWELEIAAALEQDTGAGPC
jgi:hypothetical protein